jgi:hypothetical protein
MNYTHSSFKRFVPISKEIWLFVIRIISIVAGKKFRSCENRIDLNASVAIQKRTDSDSGSHGEEKISEILYSPLVQSIRENHANIEKIASYEWEDMENQDPGDVF